MKKTSIIGPLFLELIIVSFLKVYYNILAN